MFAACWREGAANVRHLRQPEIPRGPFAMTVESSNGAEQVTSSYKLVLENLEIGGDRRIK